MQWLSFSVDARRARRLGPFALVAVLHAALFWWATTMWMPQPPRVTPPTSISVMPVSEPKPLPARPQPLRAEPHFSPVPVVTLPPPVFVPDLPPTIAVQAEPPAAPLRRAPDLAMTPPAAPPAPPPEVAEPPKPVTPPRSDANFLSNPAPAYPPLSRRLRQQGRVLLDVYILADGSVGEIKLKRSSGHASLDDAALQAVRLWRYVPAKRGDEPIPYWYVQPLDFAIDPSAS